jgi:hypothetical protein
MSLNWPFWDVKTAAVIKFMSLKTCVLWLVVNEVLKPDDPFTPRDQLAQQ